MAEVTLFLAGDVMTGRGVDQILPHPGPPELREELVTDARRYVALAESVAGPVPRPAPPAWPWGDALRLLDAERPDARIVNLETAVTARGEHHPGKGIHYRMHPANLPCLTAARLDVCALGNNHVLDFGPTGLVDTVDALRGAGIRTAGAGRDAEEAWRPAAVPLAGDRRLLVWSLGAVSSGVFPQWAAGAGRPGVAYLPEVPVATAGTLAERIARTARPADLVVVSVHWGSNWGHEVPDEHVEFAHALIDAGVHVVHGHSSHHPRAVERYRGRLVLYGCGDLIDDYEGIGGQEAYRPELRLLYLATLDAVTGELRGLRLVPLRMRRMRLRPATAEEAGWLADLLDTLGRPSGTRVTLAPDGVLTIR
ncbi:CapA family protein [Micromonospora sp. NPDC005305]|uniref:CapA family protein n=1 Tax=Micromonospora sp. NPDC005305 TaxID=3156875 RepID=UPI0033A93856